ncbi:aldehyde dehydrogenase [Vibrio maritimus]|uniref:Aldehyde dehydrogenase n=1 Tax=Vibrio maritimus TaxID=990268 RepID=A0A090TEA7_9VIBR|nr:aldehyde dehydrogenase [Vibrio maritimus]
MSEMIDWSKSGLVECNNQGVSELTTWFSELKQAYQQETNPSLAIRKQRLQALKTQLTRYQDVLAAAMSDDFGSRSHTESIMADVMAPVLDIKHVLSHLKAG